MLSVIQKKKFSWVNLFVFWRCASIL